MTNGLPPGVEGAVDDIDGPGQPGDSAKPPQAFEVLPASIDDFDAVINGDVKTFVNMSDELGGLVANQVHQFRSVKALSSFADAESATSRPRQSFVPSPPNANS